MGFRLPKRGRVNAAADEIDELAMRGDGLATGFARALKVLAALLTLAAILIGIFSSGCSQPGKASVYGKAGLDHYADDQGNQLSGLKTEGGVTYEVPIGGDPRPSGRDFADAEAAREAAEQRAREQAAAAAAAEREGPASAPAESSATPPATGPPQSGQD